MTNERAIELLNRISDSQFDGEYGDERREALEMAVRALEGDGDTISRQAVMKEFSDFVRKSNNSDFAQTPTWNDAVSLVGSMPSAQPQSTMGQVNDTVQSTKDCISRQQAIDALDVKCLHRGIVKGLQAIIEDLPSAQPERKKARWLDSQGKEKYVRYCAECSACGGWSEYITDFCPNCGADMRGESE